MGMIKQNYGIKYPLTCQNDENLFFDLNGNLDEKLLSEILHVILTPKGQRLRKPNFGTNLIKFVFEQNDENTWQSVKEECTNAISLWVPNSKLKNMRLLNSEEADVEADDNQILLYLEYTVKKGETEEINKALVTL